MILRELTSTDEQKYLAFVKEWTNAGASKITPSSVHLNGLTFQEWLVKLEKDKLSEQNDFVPAETLFLEVANKLVGAVQLRYKLTEGLVQIGGNIGFGVVPFERGKGYANVLLAQSLEIFQKRGFSKVMLTCDKINMSSKKTIQKNGGILSAEYLVEGTIVQRFWIELAVAKNSE